MADPADLDVDARFLLANERTLLAWVRTSLTLLAAGVGALQLIEDRWGAGPGLGLLALATVAAGAGMARFRRADEAIRSGRLPPAGRAPVAVAAGVASVALVLTVVGAVDRLGG